MSVKGYPTANGTVPTAQLIAANQIMTSTGTILAGNGFVNYILEPHENSFGNWFTSNASLVTVATTTTAANLPSGSFGSALVITRVSGTTGYVATRFTLNIANYNVRLQYLQDMIYAGTAGDYQLQIWSNTASNYGGTSTQLTLPVTNIPLSTGSTFNTTFIAPASTAPYIEVRIVATAGTTPLYLNNVTVTPGQLVQGAAVSGAVTFTPVATSGFGTISNASGWYVRSGNLMRGRMQFKVGTLTTSGPVVSVPGGFNYDSNLMTQGRTKFGIYNISSAGGVNLFSATDIAGLVVPGGSTTEIGFARLNATDASNNVYVQNGNGTTMMQNNGSVSFDFEIPVAEWAGNGTVNLGAGAQVEYASESGAWDAAGSATQYGPAGAAITGALTSSRSKTITWQYPIQPTDQITVEYKETATASWTPMPGLFPYGLQNTTELGVAWGLTSSTTQTRVDFSQYRRGGTTYGGAGTAWVNGAFWRVKKCAPSAPVGFGLATATQSGLFNAGQNPGIATTGDAAVGNIGEFIQSRQTTLTNFPTTTQFGDGASISLTPGDWDVTFVVDGNVNAATMTAFTAGISSTSGNSSTGLQFGDNELSAIVPTVATDSSIVIPTFRVSLAATTTYYGKVSATYSLGNPQYRCRLSARRMR